MFVKSPSTINVQMNDYPVVAFLDSKLKTVEEVSQTFIYLKYQIYNSKPKVKKEMSCVTKLESLKKEIFKSPLCLNFF